MKMNCVGSCVTKRFSCLSIFPPPIHPAPELSVSGSWIECRYTRLFPSLPILEVGASSSPFMAFYLAILLLRWLHLSVSWALFILDYSQPFHPCASCITGDVIFFYSPAFPPQSWLHLGLPWVLLRSAIPSPTQAYTRSLSPPKQARSRELETVQQTAEELQLQIQAMDGTKGWFERRLKEAEVRLALDWGCRGVG